MRDFKIIMIPMHGQKTYTYHGYDNGVCIFNSSKHWRHKGDCTRAAKAWCAKCA